MTGCYEKYVGYDGKSFYCKLCGKAGFKSPKAVIGHLNSCPAKNTFFGCYDRSDEQVEYHQQRTTTIDKSRKRIKLKVVNLMRRIDRLEEAVFNELSHLRAEQLIEKYNNKHRLIAISLLAFFAGVWVGCLLSRSSSSEFFDKIGQKILNSFVNKGVSYMWKQIA